MTTDPRLMSDPVSATEQVSISRRRGRWNSSPFPWCSFNVTSNLRKTCLRPVHSINYSSTTVFFPKCMQPENRGKGREGKQGTELGKLSITFFFFHSLTDVASWIIYIVPAFIKQFLRPERGGKNRRNKN